MTQPTLPNINRARHSNLGKAFEAEIAAANEYYLLRGLVDVVQNPNSWEFAAGSDFWKYKALFEAGDPRAARTGDGRYLLRALSDVDFSGGNFIFDTKETNGKSFPLANVSAHQVTRLARSSRTGTCAGILIKFSELARVFFVPEKFLSAKYEAWQRASAGGRRAPRGSASLSISEMEKHGAEVRPHRTNGLWDWLAALTGDGK